MLSCTLSPSHCINLNSNQHNSNCRPLISSPNLWNLYCNLICHLKWLQLVTNHRHDHWTKSLLLYYSKPHLDKRYQDITKLHIRINKFDINDNKNSYLQQSPTFSLMERLVPTTNSFPLWHQRQRVSPQYNRTHYTTSHHNSPYQQQLLKTKSQNYTPKHHLHSHIYTKEKLSYWQDLKHLVEKET